jgi:transposase
MNFITTDREQVGILGYSLRDFVEEGSKPLFIVKLIRELDLREIKVRYSPQGGEAYDPEIMLGILFLSYSEGITSSRKIERKCKKDMDFIYISGNLRPDHCSISRFRQNHIDLVGKYFVEIVRKAQQCGISDFKTMSMDGTKIQASSSKKKSYRERGLDKYIIGVEKDIQEYLKKSEAEEEVERKETKEKIEKLENKKENLQKRREELKKNKKELKAKDRENHQINIVEPEAKMMIHSGGRGSPSYNVQIVTDTKSGIIVSNDAVQDRNDEKQFNTQQKKSESILGADKDRKYISDTGYSSLEELKKASEAEIKAYIGIGPEEKKETIDEIAKSGRKIKKSDFKYEAAENQYICPNGEILEYQGDHKKGKYEISRYKTEKCKSCKLLKQCHREKRSHGKYKTVDRDKRERYMDEMRKKMRSTEGKEMLDLRRQTVEPVFGNLKQNLGFRRFSLRGLEKVKGEFNLMCIGHNINKLFCLLLCLIIMQIVEVKTVDMRYHKK